MISHEIGKGKNAGRLGALVCVDKVSKKMFKIGTGFTNRERDAPPAIGSLVTYKYQNLTNDGLPRFPVYMRVRTD